MVLKKTDDRMLGRREFILASASLAAFGGCRLFDSEPQCTQPYFRLGADGTFRFLQLTDLHLRPGNAALNDRMVALLRSAFEKCRPSLAVLTGDNVSGRESSARAAFGGTVEPLIALLREYGIRFCVTFGNHDSEHGGADQMTRQEQYDCYKAMGGELFVDHNVAELSGVGSGVISVFGRDRVKPAFNLFVMDSGSYAGGGYDGCRTDQIAWYERVSGDVPALWFQHIIVPDVNVHGLFVDAPPSADPKAKEGPTAGYDMMWPDGKRRMLLAKGVAGELKEHTCPPKWNVYRDEAHTFEGRSLYDSWRKMGNLKGAYFGHDHMNSFDGTDANGIRLGMTKCSSFYSYNDGRPGVRLFTLKADGSYETEMVI